MKKWLKDFIYDSLGNEIPLTSQQKEIIKKSNEIRFNLFLKSRQIGFSTLLKNLIAYKLLSNEDRTICLVTLKKVLGINSLKDIKKIILFIEPRSIESIKIDSILLTNGSKLILSNLQPDSIRGYDIDDLIFDECFDMSFYICAIPNMLGKVDSSVIIGTSLYEESIIKLIDGLDNTVFKLTKLQYNDSELYDEKKISAIKKLLIETFDFEYELNLKGFKKYLNKKKNKKTVTIQCRIEEELYDKLLDITEEKKISISEYLRELLNKNLE